VWSSSGTEPRLVVLAGLAFISLGLPDGLLGVAWPSIRASFGRDLDALGVVLVASTLGYVASSFSSGRLLQHVNLGAVLAISCLSTALALLGYAAAGTWVLLVVLSVLLGMGGGAIDAALNTYAAVRHGSRALNWLHACYGIGAALGPVVMTAVLSRGRAWQNGYALVGGAQVLLALSFVATMRRWPRTSGVDADDRRDVEPGAPPVATIALPAARLLLLTFIVYAGVEASIGAWTYTLLTAGRGMPPSEAGALVSLFWTSLTGGRLVAAAAGHRLPVTTVLGAAVSIVTIGTTLLWVGGSAVWALAGVVLTGGACGPVFPTLVATTPARLGPAHTANAVGFQIAGAAVGLSIVPALVGVVADTAGVALIAPSLVLLAALLAIVYVALERTAPPNQ
jgi:fucose permease